MSDEIKKRDRAAQKRPKAVQRRQPEEVRARIIEAAIVAFTQDGFKGARMRSIAADANISIQLLVHHAKSKENLWHMMMEHFQIRFDKFYSTVQTLPADSTSADKLRRQIADLVNFTTHTPELHRVMVQEGGMLSPRMVWLTENFTKSKFDEWCALIEQAQCEGAVHAGSPAQLRYAIVGMASVPFSVSAEYEFLTGKNPFSGGEVAKLIKLITDLVFID